MDIFKIKRRMKFVKKTKEWKTNPLKEHKLTAFFKNGTVLRLILENNKFLG